MIHPLLISLLMRQSGAPASVHIKIDGQGFLRFARAGKPVYASEVSLVVRNSLLTTKYGWPVLPEIHVPQSALQLSVTLDGRVFAVESSGKEAIGQLVLAMFDSSIRPTGFFTTALRPTISNPGDGLAGVVRTVRPATVVPVTEEPAPKNPATPTETHGPALSIDLSQRSIVDHEDLTLGDLGNITGPNDLVQQIKAVSLGKLSPFGVAQKYSQGFLTAKIRSAGVRIEDSSMSIPFECSAVRDTQPVTADQIAQAAVDEVRRKLGASVSLRPGTALPDIKVPKGTLTFQVDMKEPSNRSVSAEVFMVVDGRVLTSRVLSLVPDDPTQIVNPGDVVTIRLISSGAIVEVPGKALSTGWIGQKVSAQSDLGTTHSGIVVGGGIVEVRL